MRWKKLFDSFFAAKQKTIHTNIVSQVVSYDASTNTCSVQPCVKVQRTNDPYNMEPLELPQVDNLPVKQFGSGKLLLSVAPAVGSYGNLVVTESSIEAWINDGGIVNPTSSRMHHFSDGFFDSGLYPLKVDGDNGKLESPIATDRISIRTRSGDTQVSVLDDDSVLIETTGKVIANCDGVEIDGTVDVNGTVTAISDVVASNLVAGNVSLYSHVHASPGAPPTPIPPIP